MKKKKIGPEIIAYLRCSGIRGLLYDGEPGYTSGKVLGAYAPRSVGEGGRGRGGRHTGAPPARHTLLHLNVHTSLQQLCL